MYPTILRYFSLLILLGVFACTFNLSASNPPDSGCTDPCAANYDPAAEVDDGSCEPYETNCNTDCTLGALQEWDTATCSCILATVVDGCMNVDACNYNPNANCDDGSCDYGIESCLIPCGAVLGCTDASACNFDPLATCDDGSCSLPDGCTDESACNYDPTATCSDWSCYYGVEGCENPCTDVLGCTDESACNFNPVATCNDGSCLLPNGCTFPAACNYDPTATCDDGSCEFGPTQCADPCNAVLGCTDEDDCNYNPAATCNDDSCVGPCDTGGCTDPCAANYDPEATEDNGSCEPYDNTCNTDCTFGDIELWDAHTCSCVPYIISIPGCIDTEACNYDPTASCDDGSCTYFPCKPGCTDPCAPNYDAWADDDDGSCEPYDMTCNTDCTLGAVEVWNADMCACVVETVSINGCTDESACNYNPDANCDNGSCNFGNEMCDTPCNAVLGCTDETACNYDATATCDDGSCTPGPCNPGCTDPCAANYDPDALTDDGSCEPYDTTCNTDCTQGDIAEWDMLSCSCVTVNASIAGCTNENACNYNPDANCNDDSCEFGNETCESPCDAVLGCTDETACNYDVTATCDDGSCIDVPCNEGCTDPCAPNYDATAFTDDGSCESYDMTCNTDCTLGAIEIWSSDMCACVVETASINGCTDETACNYNTDANCNDDSCTYPNDVCENPCSDIAGCMDETACNYDPDANCNDSSCTYAPCNAGCTDPCASNYNPDADGDDGSCEPYDATCNTDCTQGDIQEWDASTCSCISVSTSIVGCMDENACNYNPDANCASSDCQYLADSGPDQSVCGFSTTLDAIGTGVWSTNFGLVNFEDPLNAQTTVTVDQAGSYIFFWTTTHMCGDTIEMTSDPITVLFFEPHEADAGDDITVCADSYPLSANTPTTLASSGTWTVVEGSGTFADDNDPTTTVSGLSEGNNTFQWTVAGPFCPTVSDQVMITISYDIEPFAGEDDNACGYSYGLQATDSGTWSGNGNFSDVNDPNATVSVGELGTYTFTWNVSEECGGGTDQVTITFEEDDTHAEAGADQTICGFTTTLEAILEDHHTGMWLSNFGGVTFDDETDPTTQVTVSQPGNYIFFWTEIDVCGNEEMFDTDMVTISFSVPNAADAGEDAAICETSYELSANDDLFDLGTSGMWTVVQGSGEFEEDDEPITIVSGLSPGINILEWSLFGFVCEGSSDQIIITVAEPGCTDPHACNYNPDAGCEDNATCFYAPCVVGCTDPCAANYNPDAEEDDGSCEVYDKTCDDGCDLTHDFYSYYTCDCQSTIPELDDGCSLTIDLFDATNCLIIHQAPDCNDNDECTIDSFDESTCMCINEQADCGPGSVTGTVFLDSNGNNMQDDGEIGLEGIIVLLYDMDGNIVAQTITDSNGDYFFFDVPEGQYYVLFDIPSTYVAVIPNVGNDAFDSDIGTDGATMFFNVTMGEVIANLDAGLMEIDVTPCADFAASADAICNEDNYEIIFSFIGGGPNGYIITDNNTGVEQTTTENFILYGPFDLGTGYDYTITLADDPQCSENYMRSVVDCISTAVELLSFTGSVERNGNLLKWTTASEENNEHFRLMRSINGIDFEEIAKINGADNSNITLNYDYLDRDTPQGLTYYRLDQVDFDGKETSSEIITLDRKSSENQDIVLWPNPTTDFINVQYHCVNAISSQISIYNTQGQLVKVIEKDSQQGLNYLNILTDAFTNGLYFVEIRNEGQSIIQRSRFVKR